VVTIVPKSILIGIALYTAALILTLWDGGIFVLILGTPALLFQGFLLFGVYKRQNWARIAFLIFVLFLIGRELPSYGYVFRIAPPGPITSSLTEMLVPLLRVGAVACFFLKASTDWLLSTPPKSPKKDDSNEGQATSPRIESRHFGFGSTASIGTGILVAGVAIGAFYIVFHNLRRSMPSDADARELKPGDANYPIETAIPTRVIPFVVSGMEFSNYKFNAGYGSDVKLCGHQIALGGYFPYGLTIPIEMASTEGGKYRGSIIIDKFQSGKCGWKFIAVGYTRPDGVGNALGVLKERQSNPLPQAAPHIEMWCYRVTEGQFKSPDPKCEILGLLRWPNAERRVSAEFLATFSDQQQHDNGWAAITTETKELSVEFHDLNGIPGALVPVGDRATQIKAREEATAAQEASPEGQAAKCFESANIAYGRTRPQPDTATIHTQRDAVFALRNKCRADFGLPPVNPE
jgi:hypothetical protein